MGHPRPGPDSPQPPTQSEPPAPPRPRPRQAPRDAVPVAGHTALTVQPGQTLIVTVPDASSPERAADISKAIRERLPGVEVLVLGGVQQIAVYDPATAPETA